MKLFHASTKKNLSKLNPQPTLSNDEYIGDFVFATANFTMALMYLSPKGIPALMNPSESDPNIVICSDIENFRSKDQGGAIYIVSPKNFTKTPQHALSDYEMVSKQPVEPKDKIIYKSTLSAMMDAKIKIKFVNEKVFNNLIGNPQQKELIDRLPSY